MNTFYIEVAHRCSDNRGPTLYTSSYIDRYIVSVIYTLPADLGMLE